LDQTYFEKPKKAQGLSLAISAGRQSLPNFQMRNKILLDKVSAK
jgi:hypothetical protein